MKTFSEYIEAKNHLGETQYNSWGAWIKAIKINFPTATIEGDKDIASAFVGNKSVGEWDGVVGVIYQNHPKLADNGNTGIF